MRTPRSTRVLWRADHQAAVSALDSLTYNLGLAQAIREKCSYYSIIPSVHLYGHIGADWTGSFEQTKVGKEHFVSISTKHVRFANEHEYFCY